MPSLIGTGVNGDGVNFFGEMIHCYAMPRAATSPTADAAGSASARGQHTRVISRKWLRPPLWAEWGAIARMLHRMQPRSRRARRTHRSGAKLSRKEGGRSDLATVDAYSRR